MERAAGRTAACVLHGVGGELADDELGVIDTTPPLEQRGDEVTRFGHLLKKARESAGPLGGHKKTPRLEV